MSGLWQKIAPDLWHHVSKPFAYVNQVLINLNENKPVLDYNDLIESPPFNVSVATPTGAILLFAGSVAPTGYLLLGTDIYVSRITYSSLFAIIGVVFGTTTPDNFKLPDTAGVLPRGVGTSTGYTANTTIALGEKLDDAFQGHQMDLPNGVPNNITSGPTSGGGITGTVNLLKTGNPISDGTNGTPRTSSSTRDKTIGLNYIIKT
jgi:hypothetical protein